MSARINIDQFKESFADSINALAQSEAVTKRELLALSRSLLNVLHNGPEGLLGDIGYINRLCAILTPVNKKVAREFFIEFSGFLYSDQAAAFVKKDGRLYEQKKKAANEFLADPHNNIWTWAERNIDVVKKEFDINQAAEFFKKFVKKAEKNGLSQKDVVKNILGAGVTLDTLLEIMTSSYGVDPAESKIVVTE